MIDKGALAGDLRVAMKAALSEMLRGLDDAAVVRLREELASQLDRVLTHAPMPEHAVQSMSGRAAIAALCAEVLRERTGSAGRPWSVVQDKS
ncbi:hypothetical protein [Roseomonas indoligenes]|uniref:Uncharacterized protein n=1 Tax=Roseomonas indoligenes TaxID=2820811 RepID=A0A940MZ66_9PROT|nr:hypothetical protein [Pararoseomonas indoligenes]MBP0496054.1 hypothetical protein [Pararoseomonas indoligenes]